MNSARIAAVGERRIRERTASTVADDFTRLHNALALEHATVVHLEDQVDKLISENRRLREAVHKAARVIETLGGSPVFSEPDGPAKGLRAGESSSSKERRPN